ncbi:uncharacterized protein LOC100274752 precursor [Zea mays]|uniref:Mesoderm development candidate 2 n=2 Tax=Zea mays TaxID=4577 RepID=A0A1D6JNR4_MAIZE|nr:uncharacterized protein LOC100274752 precursor [Zea mays]ONL93667.1 hypothetical protein ZEAMMB73_Zm00001d027674 [Zea mays]|eukprot:NP_001142516.2 uncharacterized protein LOC100274752 precursor [Zea mays]
MQTVSSVLILTRMPRMTCRVALAAVLLCAAVAAALGGKRAPIPDDLRDVIDDEEDDEWRRYGTPPSRGPGRGDGPPPDLSRMDPAALQDELLRGQTGPSFGFVKLRPGTARSREDVVGIATRWSNVLRTGSVDAKFVAVNFGTLMFTMERGRDILELKEFILSQDEAYEFKVGDRVFRRPGDPPLDQVLDKPQKKKRHKSRDEL